MMPRQARKTSCYLFTVNRIDSLTDVFEIQKLLASMTDYLVIGLEPKELIGSSHIQGCFKLNSFTTYSSLSQHLKLFLNKKENNPSAYFKKIKSSSDLLKTTKYCIKYRKAIINSNNYFVVIDKTETIVFKKSKILVP